MGLSALQRSLTDFLNYTMQISKSDAEGGTEKPEEDLSAGG